MLAMCEDLLAGFSSSKSKSQLRDLIWHVSDAGLWHILSILFAWSEQEELHARHARNTYKQQAIVWLQNDMHEVRRAYDELQTQLTYVNDQDDADSLLDSI